jgi:hypothetical protein
MVPANTSGLEVKDITEVPDSIWSTVIRLIASTARSGRFGSSPVDGWMV